MNATRVLWDDVPADVKDALAGRTDVKVGGTAIVDRQGERWYFRKTQFGWNNQAVDREAGAGPEVAPDLTPAQKEEALRQVKKVEDAMAARAAERAAAADLPAPEEDEELEYVGAQTPRTREMLRRLAEEQLQDIIKRMVEEDRYGVGPLSEAQQEHLKEIRENLQRASGIPKEFFQPRRMGHFVGGLDPGGFKPGDQVSYDDGSGQKVVGRVTSVDHAQGRVDVVLDLSQEQGRISYNISSEIRRAPRMLGRLGPGPIVDREDTLDFCLPEEALSHIVGLDFGMFHPGSSLRVKLPGGVDFDGCVTELERRNCGADFFQYKVTMVGEARYTS